MPKRFRLTRRFPCAMTEDVNLEAAYASRAVMAPAPMDDAATGNAAKRLKAFMFVSSWVDCDCRQCGAQPGSDLDWHTGRIIFAIFTRRVVLKCGRPRRR